MTACTPANLHALKQVEMADKYQWVTLVYAVATVEAEEYRGGLPTHDRIARRRPKRGMVASRMPPVNTTVS
jgi:hypothetical protein